VRVIGRCEQCCISYGLPRGGVARRLDERPSANWLTYDDGTARNALDRVGDRFRSNCKLISGDRFWHVGLTSMQPIVRSHVVYLDSVTDAKGL